MSVVVPGYDQIVLTAADGDRLCHSLACARAGRAAVVMVTFGTLNDPGACVYARGALWRESWGMSYPMCGGCWKQTRQVAARYRPGLLVTGTAGDSRAPAAQAAGGRA